jgi:hypothetical protein
MPEAANADLVFTISLKRSTLNIQLSKNSPADYPIFGSYQILSVLLLTKLRAFGRMRLSKIKHCAN